MGDNPLERVSQRRRRAQLMSKMSVQDQSVEGFIAGKQCFMKPSKQRASSTEKVLKGCTNVAGQLHVLGSSRKGLVASRTARGAIGLAKSVSRAKKDLLCLCLIIINHIYKALPEGRAILYDIPRVHHAREHT